MTGELGFYGLAYSVPIKVNKLIRNKFEKTIKNPGSLDLSFGVDGSYKNMLTRQRFKAWYDQQQALEAAMAATPEPPKLEIVPKAVKAPAVKKPAVKKVATKRVAAKKVAVKKPVAKLVKKPEVTKRTRGRPRKKPMTETFNDKKPFAPVAVSGDKSPPFVTRYQLQPHVRAEFEASAAAKKKPLHFDIDGFGHYSMPETLECFQKWMADRINQYLTQKIELSVLLNHFGVPATRNFAEDSPAHVEARRLTVLANSKTLGNASFNNIAALFSGALD